MTSDNVYLLMSLQMQIPGVLACLSTLLIIVTYVIFEDLRKLRYLQLVFYMAVNDFIASLGVSLGYVKSGTPACWFQGLVSNANYVSSSFWNVVITYHLWLAVQTGTIIQDLTFIQIFCWGFPWIVALLPLTTSTYGDTDDLDSWCFIKNTTDSPGWSLIFWYLLSFYVWILLSVTIIIVLLIDIARKVWSGSTSDLVKSSLKKLIVYPIIILFCWIPSAVSDFMVSDNRYSFLVSSMANIVPVTQGIFAGIVFFTQNPIVRQKWAKLLSYSWCGWLFQSAASGGVEFGAASENDISRESDYVSSNGQSLQSTFGTAHTFDVRASELTLFGKKKSIRMSTLDEFSGP